MQTCDSVKTVKKMARRSDFWFCIGASVWTIIQTIIHAYWIIYGRKLIFCPNNPNEVTRPSLNLYFTQISTYSCNDSVANNHVNVQNVNSYVRGILKEKNESELLFAISYNYEFEMTDTLMNIYIVHDALWLIASVSLLVGTVLRIKETSALIFFAPWITLNLIGITFDVFSAVYYCLQIPHSQSKHFHTSKPENGTIFGLIIPRPLIMALVSGRLGLFWLLNFVLLVLVAKATIKAYKANYQEENRIRRRGREALNNSAQARIRNWQQFYGVIEENSKNELSYSNTFQDFESNNKDSRFNDLEATRITSPFCSTMVLETSNNGHAPKNIVSFGQSQSVEHTVPTNCFRGQLPWTYTPTNDMAQNIELPNIMPKPRSVMRIFSNAKIDNWDSSNEQVSTF